MRQSAPDGKGQTSADGLIASFRGSHGVRSGLVLLVATMIFNVSAYLFNLACIRYLGSRAYGDVAALAALGALVALPLASVQTLLAREVAELHAQGATNGVRRLFRRGVRLALPIGLALLSLGLLFGSLLERALKIGSWTTVAAGLSVIVFALLAPVLYGVLQGSLRFVALGMSYVVSGLARPVLVIPALVLGLGAAGALVVNTVAGFIAIVFAAVALRDLWAGPVASTAIVVDRREVAVLVAGSLAFTSLTNTDVLLASYYLSDTDAGVYAAAAFVGKIVLFLPSAAAIVLLPKATWRVARGITPHRILLASTLVTAVLTATAAFALSLVPERLLVWAFGGEYREATALLGWFGLAMVAAALVNVYLSVYFAQRDVRFPLVVALAALTQIVGIILWHSEPRSIVLVTMFCCFAVLLIHEVAFPNRLTRIWRATEPAHPAPVARP